MAAKPKLSPAEMKAKARKVKLAHKRSADRAKAIAEAAEATRLEHEAAAAEAEELEDALETEAPEEIPDTELWPAKVAAPQFPDQPHLSPPLPPTAYAPVEWARPAAADWTKRNVPEPMGIEGTVERMEQPKSESTHWAWLVAGSIIAVLVICWVLGVFSR
jgi:hypothetical protein